MDSYRYLRFFHNGVGNPKNLKMCELSEVTFTGYIYTSDIALNYNFDEPISCNINLEFLNST